VNKKESTQREGVWLRRNVNIFLLIVQIAVTAIPSSGLVYTR
jgi:hypothetical protein